MPDAPPKPEPRPANDFLIGGIVSLLIGVVSEAVLHPIVPWTYMPGALFVMLGLGIGTAVLSNGRPREGTVVYYVVLAGVALWFFQSLQSISLLAPMLYTGSYQLTRWALKLKPL